MLTSIITTPINRILRNEGWACKQLQSFAGQTVCIRILPLINFKVLVDTEGEVQQVHDSICAGTTLTLSPFILPRILMRESAAFKQIKIVGNRSLADELINIGKQINLGMILEHDLSQAIGDIPAHRITNASEHFTRWHAENLTRMSQALVEYWTEENSLLTKSTAAGQFLQEVKSLKFNTEQLEQRINALIRKNALTRE